MNGHREKGELAENPQAGTACVGGKNDYKNDYKLVQPVWETLSLSEVDDMHLAVS